MKIQTLILFQGFTSPKAKMPVNNAMKQTNESLAWHWYDTYLPKHFTRAAYREYGYLPRQGEPGAPPTVKRGREVGFRHSYTGYKLKKYKHTNPYMFRGWNGGLISEALNKSMANVNSKKLSKSQVSISFPLGRANMSPRIGKVAADELTRVSVREVMELQDWYLDKLADNLNQIGLIK